MATYLSMKMKRKNLETDHANNDVSDFILSYPACKIRRLDADLPPVINQEDPEIPLRFEQHSFPEFGAADEGESQLRRLVVDEVPPVAHNQEKAIVPVNPINTLLLDSSSNFVVDADLISSIKEQGVWGLNPNSSKSLEDKVSKADDRLALIPWVPSEQFHRVLPPEVLEMEVSEPMDTEEMGATKGSGAQSMSECIHMTWSSESAPHQWQQQHCKMPQHLQNTTTAIAWYR